MLEAIVTGRSVRPSVCSSHSWSTPKGFKISKYVVWHRPMTERCC